ncbi:transporter [Hymenobacter puniceus]|uniref:transporter n=1 Tax=Hymenobacter sp. BT190 TaxID=2763505 RepID=UPI001650EE74|nr:transporter [Hymenobacter sp. BT190]MBC6700522.1 transporter [Hymenobacter sp. BT190]
MLLTLTLALGLTGAPTAPDTLKRPGQTNAATTGETPQRQLRPLNADRPGVTESPNTIDPGHFQLETDLVRLINSKPGQETRSRTLRLNAFAIRAGLTDHTEVQVFVDPYTVEKQWAPGEPMARSAGFGDVAVRVKHNFIGDDDETEPLVVAAIGFVRLPTGGSEGAGGFEYGILVPATYNFQHEWHLSAQAASFLSYDRDAKQHAVELAPSFAVDHGFNDWLAAFAEFSTRRNLKTRQWTSAINVGPIFHVSERVQLDFGRRFALSSSADREYYLGFVIER